MSNAELAPSVLLNQAVYFSSKSNFPRLCAPTNHLLRILAVSWLLILISGCSPADETVIEGDSNTQVETEAPAVASYIGSSGCRDCHQQQWQDWQGSQHDLALQQASSETILADFSGSHAGMTFAREGEQFLVKPDDQTEPLPVRYTFGVAPLQQYVVEADNGRLQTLPVPWDTRPESLGGQRWYELYPGDFPPGDPMHWTGSASNWNGMCADCHSTGVSKGYDPTTFSYQTTFIEEDVACEACHGPGSNHVSAVRAGETADYQPLNDQASQINSCAPCHSRRSQLAEGFTPAQSYFDYYQPSLLAQHLYHPDGQILEEVYVYGSFLQSRMHLQGVTCSNCHDPHSAELKLSGNETCTQCHNPAGRSDFPTLKPALYDDPAHHHHVQGSAAAACVNCHMTSKVYMGVDERRDHSFRIPRPDLTQSLGVPNACNTCHQDRDAGWANSEIISWFGERPPHYGTAFAAGQRGDADAEAELAAIASDSNQPIMVRASALALLGNYNRGYTLDAIRAASNGSPLLQLGATDGAASLSAESQWRLLSPLLSDEHLAVRNAAFSALLPLAADPAYADRLQAYFPAYIDSLQASRDFPGTLVNLANAYFAMGDRHQAEALLDEALTVQPSFVPALLNQADLYRATLRDAEAEELLQQALTVAPESAQVAYSHALWLTRQQQPTAALKEFRRAATLAPDELQYGYALAIALNDSGQGAQAVRRLETLLSRWPDNTTLLSALVTMLRDQQRYEEALNYLEPLLQQNPNDQSLRQLETVLRSLSG